MSYLSISQAATDPLLRARIAACCAQESTSGLHATQLADGIQWQCCGEPGWGEAWESAKAAGGGDDIGADPAVITDPMILAAVQKHLAKGPAA